MDTGSTATDVNTHRDSLTQGGVDVPVAPKAHRIVGPKGNSLPNHGRTIPSLYFAWIWDPISRFNGGFHAYPTTIDVPMLGRDATRVSTIQGGSVSQLHLGSIVIHLENPRGTNFSKLLPPIVRGIRWQCRPNGAYCSFSHPNVIVWHFRCLDVPHLSDHVKRPNTRMVRLLEVAFHQFFCLAREGIRIILPQEHALEVINDNASLTKVKKGWSACRFLHSIH